MGRLIRYILIVSKLSGTWKYTDANELIEFLSHQMYIRDFTVGLSLRTLQRDLKEIQKIFGIEIKHKKDRGYYIAEKSDDVPMKYGELLMNYDLLTSISEDSKASLFILPEHHRPKGNEYMPLLIEAIKENRKVRFDYVFYRRDNKVKTFTVYPYYLKESLGLWYLIARNEKNELKAYGVDRIIDPEVLDEKFVKDETLNPNDLYTHSYGIWDDPQIPVENIELSFSPLDGNFLKALPLHSSQTVLIDNEKEFRIRLNLRITNDFVMAIMSRSSSLRVIAPDHLKKRIAETAFNCYKRNS